MARPKAQVDEDKVERAAAIGCTVAEIAVVLGVDKRTLERRFAASIEKGRERGRRSLRRLQWKNARSGNVTMQIWLGKQLLGQADKVEHTGEGGGPVKTETTHKFDHDQFSRELEDVRRERGFAAGRSVPPNGN